MKTVSTIIFFLITTVCFSQRKTNHITISRHNSQCIIDEENTELIPSRHYSDIWTAYDTIGKYFVVTDFKRKKGIYELGIKEIVPCIYDDIRMFGNHGFVKKEKNWAILSGDFKEVTDFVFEDVSYFDKAGQSLLKENAQWKLIDTNGRTLKQLPFDEVFQFNEDDIYKKAGLNKKYGFIDRNYKPAIPLEYADVGIAVQSTNDVFSVKKGDKWGYVNKRNDVVVPCKYAYVTPIYKGFGWIRDKNYNTIGLVNADGKVLFENKQYVEIEYAQEGKLIYTIKNPTTGRLTKGYLDSASFQIRIGPKFESCENFINGLAIVKMSGLAGLIDTTGRFIVPLKYEFINRWGNFYLVTLKGKTGMIDRIGKVIVPLEYENYSCSGSFATITKNGLKGILHISGKVLITPKYDNVQAISEEVFYAIKGVNKFLTNLSGVEKEIE